jgi:hypothetical protein
MLTDADWLCQDVLASTAREYLILKHNSGVTGFSIDPPIGAAFITKTPTFASAIRLFRAESAY